MAIQMTDETINNANVYGLIGIAELLGRELLYDKAVEVLEKILDEDEKIKEEKSSTLFDLAQFSFDIGFVDEAIQISKKIPDEDYKSEIFFSMIVPLCDKELFDKAVEVAKTISNDYYKSEALSIIADFLYSKGYVDKALDVIKMI